MSRYRHKSAIAVIVVAALLLPVCAQSRPIPRAPVEPTSPYAYAPQVIARSEGRSPSVSQRLQQAINPSQRDYGFLYSGWRSLAVQDTVQSVLFWLVVALFAAAGTLALEVAWLRDQRRIRRTVFIAAARVLLNENRRLALRAGDAIEQANSMSEEWNGLVAELDAAKQAIPQAVPMNGKEAKTEPLFATLTASDGAQAEVAAIEDVEFDTEAVHGGERAILYKGNKYIPLDDHDRRIRASRTKIANLRARVKQLQDLLANYGVTS